MTHQEIITWLKSQAEGIKGLNTESSAEWAECLAHHAWLLEVKLEREERKND